MINKNKINRTLKKKVINKRFVRGNKSTVYIDDYNKERRNFFIK